jgi:dihydrofolate synthase/folylpolyglutamate synthase
MDNKAIISYDYKDYSTRLSKVQSSGGFALIVNKMSITISSLKITGKEVMEKELDTTITSTYNPTDYFVGELSVITKIDVDHIEYLGGTIEKIAAEKAGIIKHGSRVITTGNQPQEVLSVLKNAAGEKGAEFILAPQCTNNRHEGMSEIFDLDGLKALKINLAGLHQTENAALAVKAALSLGIDEVHIRTGLDRAHNIGRFEKLSDNPCVIFDGAHNLNGTLALISAIERYFPDKKLSLIYAAMADKDIDASLRLLKEKGFCEKAKVFAVTVKDNPRAQTAQKLAAQFASFGFDAAAFDSIGAAYEKALAEKNPVFICGSLYLYKDFMEYTKKL